MIANLDDMKSAYDLDRGQSDVDLASVDKGTPAGELLRRYWHPILKSEDLAERPVPVRVLGEDLVAFRSGEGKVGLFHARCAHRGADLRYGKVEADGLRCCYHGWLFDPVGRCLSQPCEPEDGRLRGRIRQPAYPVRELYGLVFAYMGPLDAMPPLPRYDVLEDLPKGYVLRADDTSIGSGGPPILPCNWFQTFENVMDPYHVFILHSTFSKAQFNDLLSVRPEIAFEQTAYGVTSTQIRAMNNGSRLHRVVEALLPTVRIASHPSFVMPGRCNNVSWYLPIDETHTRIFTVVKVPRWFPHVNFNALPIYDGKNWFEMSEAEHRAFPGDYEAQVGQGPVTLHSEEHLATSDQGVALLRRLFRIQVRNLRDGRPIDPAAGASAPYEVIAGHFIHEAPTIETEPVKENSE